MKTIVVVTIIACATAITCAVLLHLAHPRYQLYGIDETSSYNGKTVKSVWRLDTISGKAWRKSSRAGLNKTLGNDEQGNPRFIIGEGWEEMSESPWAAVAKEQAEWEAGAATYRSPTPNP
jgi:hypothetical protein